MFRFSVKYFLLALALFLIEVFIAVFVHDRFIRPYFGDFLVVFLIYYAVKSVVDLKPWKLATAVLLFAYLVETLQYFHFVERVGLQQNTLARTVIGYGFEWSDMLAYTLGIIVILFFEYLPAIRHSGGKGSG